MKSITLTMDGINIKTAFKTVVTKVNNPTENSSIVVDALPHFEIALGGESATTLGIEKNTQITLKPSESGTKGSFVLEVGEKQKPKSSAPVTSKSSGALPGARMSNII